MVIAGTLIAVISVVVAPSRANSTFTSNIYLDAFRPVPKSLLINGEMMFTRLDEAQLSRVRISPAGARRIVTDQYGTLQRSRVTYESLGGFVNTTEIIHDWVGTKSFVPKARPAYIVRISGQHIESLGPAEGVVNHYWNVIVNAINGRIIGSFTFD